MNDEKDISTSPRAELLVRPPNRQPEERANRLREAVRAAGGNLVVSRRSGVPLRNLNHYIAGRDMKTEVLVALSEACNVSLDWLATGRGAMHPPAEPLITEMHTSQAPAPAPDGLTVEFGPPMPLPGFSEPASPAPPSNRLNTAALAKAIEIVEAVAGINSFHDNPKALAERIATTYAVLTRPDLDKSPPMTGG
jgi:hypothetical protein